MQSDKEIIDRIQTKVLSLIQKLEMSKEENQFLKQEIERLKKEVEQEAKPSDNISKQAKEAGNISKVKEALEGYIEEIEECIQMIK